MVMKFGAADHGRCDNGIPTETPMIILLPLRANLLFSHKLFDCAFVSLLRTGVLDMLRQREPQSGPTHHSVHL